MHKSGRKPTREEKKKLIKMGLICTEWLVVKHSPVLFVIKNKKTGLKRRFAEGLNE